MDDLVTRTCIRREELQTLADIGAFASFGYERREPRSSEGGPRVGCSSWPKRSSLHSETTLSRK